MGLGEAVQLGRPRMLRKQTFEVILRDLVHERALHDATRNAISGRFTDPSC